MATKDRPTNGLLDVVRRAAEITDSVAIGLSCGKDSLALLHLCCEHFRAVHPWYWYVTPGLSFHEATIRRCEKRYGVTVRRLPHFMLADLFRNAVYRRPSTKTLAVPRLKPADLEDEMRRQSGVEWVASGIKRSDSLERCGMLSACDGIDRKSRRLYPLAWWTDPAVYRYLKRHKIPLSGEYAVLGRSYGGQLSARELLAIRERYPEDFERIQERFPYISAELFRHANFEEAHLPAVTAARFKRERAGPEPLPEVGQGDGAPD